jgi:hypothetical protein
MYAEDRVLIGAVTRKRDLKTLREEGWYRIPMVRFPKGIHTEYLAFFTGSKVIDQPGGIYYYAEPRGMELRYRRELLPKEANHPRADEVYYRIAVSPLQPKTPAVLNPSGRSLAFIFTTWDRFVVAREIRDLYSDADYFVDRIYHALRERGIYAERDWDAARGKTGKAAGLRFLCEQGTINASTDPEDGDYFLDNSQPDDVILREILDKIASSGGPLMINVPYND